MIPLELIPPKSACHNVQKSSSIPAAQEFVIPSAKVQLLEWTFSGVNYILQQVYNTEGSLVVFLTVQISDYTLIKVKCNRAITVFQYTLKGNCFGYLKGHGCLHLFHDTYTLQYIPEGDHQVLFAPGTYHYLYLDPGLAIVSLSPFDEGIKKVLLSLNDFQEAGCLAERLPFDHKVTTLISKLKNLTPDSVHSPFNIRALINEFVLHYYEQLHNKKSNPEGTKLIAELNAFIANNIEFPVPELIARLKKQFFISGKLLRTHWKKTDFKNLRDSFNQLRMHFALYLLVIEKLTISDVANRLNYADQYNFSKLFSRFYKVSPKMAKTLVKN
ncbi:AraC family transcriptional regulator [Niabella sp.]|uniref:helix-turn-helix domain-containing protein n=1 Tax=Niabella sp. TaxID=1962976 RepID=UPI00260672C7|nr:AraC family transcriptional regulator [Niabella sp.]